MYTCPMHPEVKSGKPGRCPKCGMKLVGRVQGTVNSQDKNSYMPLVIIISLIILTSLTIELRDGIFSLKGFIGSFMIGFFLTFAGFKIIDLKGFAQGYFTYDLLAQRVFTYGYIYPFIELFFGLGMILLGENKNLLIAEVLVMGFSGLGVLIKLLKREKFQCVCLGTFLKVPLTKVTLVEDFGMAALALVLLVL